MHDWYQTHPEYLPYLTRAHVERTEAMSRAAYVAVVAVDALASRAAGVLVAGLRRAGRGYRAWQRRRRTVKELSRLDERLLRDIGILGPGEIDVIAAELTDDAEPAPVIRRTPPTAAVQPRHEFDCLDLKHAA